MIVRDFFIKMVADLSVCSADCEQCQIMADHKLSALDAAGFAVVSAGAIHRALQDAFQMGGIEAVQTLEDPNKFIKRKHRYADAALAEVLKATRSAAE